MISQQQIDDIVTWDGLREFGHFVLSYCENDGLPDYDQIDLTRVPRIVPNIFVLDERKFETTDKLMFNFAGGELTKVHGKTLLNEDAFEVFANDVHFEEISSLYRKSLAEKLTSYTKRYYEQIGDFGKKEWKTTEALFFPCSSDGETVNWGIGCAHYSIGISNGQNVYLHF